MKTGTSRHISEKLLGKENMAKSIVSEILMVIAAFTVVWAVVNVSTATADLLTDPIVDITNNLTSLIQQIYTHN